MFHTVAGQSSGGIASVRVAADFVLAGYNSYISAMTFRLSSHLLVFYFISSD